MWTPKLIIPVTYLLGVHIKQVVLYYSLLVEGAGRVHTEGLTFLKARYGIKFQNV